MFFRHYSLVPPSAWRWRYFVPSELASRGNGSLLINEDALDKLEYARNLAGRPFHINSAYRDDLYNASIGGTPRSMHTEGRAFDISLQNFNRQELIDILVKAGFTGLGINYKTFVHADTGRKRRW